jgi:transposase
MKIVGCDLHGRQQSIAMLDTETGEFTEKTIRHEGNAVREFCAELEGPVVVGIEATGSMQWFLQLLEELGIQSRVGHPAKIRAAETRKQKHDRRDARLILDLLVMEDRFPEIWMPSMEQRDLRTLLRDRHQWVKMRARLQHTLQSMALNHGLRRGPGLWSVTGQSSLKALPLAHYTSQRRNALLSLYAQLQKRIQELDKVVEGAAQSRPQACRLLTHPGVGPVTALATEVFLGDPNRFRSRVDWKKNGVKIVHAGELDTNTPQTAGMTAPPLLRTREPGPVGCGLVLWLSSHMRRPAPIIMASWRRSSTSFEVVRVCAGANTWSSATRRLLETSYTFRPTSRIRKSMPAQIFRAKQW